MPLGAATEIGPILTHRDPALADVVLDALGALTALGLAAAFDGRVWAGKRLIEIPLEAIESAPRGRRLDLRHIGRTVIFSAGSSGPRSFLLERVALR